MDEAEAPAGTKNRLTHSHSLWEQIMRFTPAALALSTAFALTASSLIAAQRAEPDPRAQAFVEDGRAALTAGEIVPAVDAFEAALAIQPGNLEAYIALAEAMRAKDLPGKAIHYYRVVLEAEPRNVAALTGEGMALAEKGAFDRARDSLARAEAICGSCNEAERLSALIVQRESAPQVAAVPVDERSEN